MMKNKRILQKIFGSIFGLLSLMVLANVLINWQRVGPAGLLFALVPLVFASIPIVMLELQMRSLKTAGERVRANIERVAQKLFDAPGAVRPGYDLSVTAGETLAAFSSTFENDAGFTTDGEYGGAQVSIASHASTMGRQVGEFNHTYSHVVVDVLGLSKKFQLTREGVGGKLARAAGVMKDAKVGDQTFDSTFIINVDDEELARDVLDESIRKRLMELQSKVSLVSIDSGVGNMSVLLSKGGLALRWPGDINPELAQYIRDLLLDMRARLLAHEDRKAARALVGETVGYRVASDVVEEARVGDDKRVDGQIDGQVEEPVNEEPLAARRL